MSRNWSKIFSLTRSEAATGAKAGNVPKAPEICPAAGKCDRLNVAASELDAPD